MKVTQLRVRDFRRRLGEQAGRGLGLGEGDYVADRVSARHQHGEAVDAKGDAAMRRRAVLERLEQEAELVLRLLGIDAEHPEHRRLHLLAVYANRATADLRAVQHEVVGTSKRG